MLEVKLHGLGLTVGTDEALAEAHTQTQEQDRCHAAHREQDDHGWTHYGTQTHALTPQHCLRFKIKMCKMYDIWTKHVR